MSERESEVRGYEVKPIEVPRHAKTVLRGSRFRVRGTAKKLTDARVRGEAKGIASAHRRV